MVRPGPGSTVTSAKPPGVRARSTVEPLENSNEAVAARREQANQDHHAIVRALNTLLHAVGCDDVSEIPGAIDLWATRPDGSRVIFEAKTISPANELSQTRTGFAQLHEYRMDGTSDDELGLVVDRALSVRRQKLLDSFGVACWSGRAPTSKPGTITARI